MLLLKHSKITAQKFHRPLCLVLSKFFEIHPVIDTSNWFILQHFDLLVCLDVYCWILNLLKQNYNNLPIHQLVTFDNQLILFVILFQWFWWKTQFWWKWLLCCIEQFLFGYKILSTGNFFIFVLRSGEFIIISTLFLRSNTQLYEIFTIN